MGDLVILLYVTERGPVASPALDGRGFLLSSPFGLMTTKKARRDFFS